MKQNKSKPIATTKDTDRQAIEIPTRDAVTQFLETADSPVTIRDIASALEVTEKPAVVALRRRLKAMTRDGQIAHTRGNRFGIAKRMELIPGNVIGHPDGFAFVRPDIGDADIFLSNREARTVLHGDRVLVRIGGLDKRDRPFGTVVEILESKNTSIVGRYYRERGVGYVSPDNRRINQDVLIPKSGKKVKHGQFVVARITQQPDKHRQPIGEIVEILGDHMAPGMEIEVATRAYELPVDWPVEVVDETEDVAQSVGPEVPEGRRDLRKSAFVTIDGSDSRDFDDAVFCKKLGVEFVLYVAIADVAHYVRDGTALDSEARNRGTSVYFPNSVIPMLPEALSNGICSLNPNVDRLAVVCEMRFDNDGEMTNYRFYNGMIKSHARLTYDEVAQWLDNPSSPKRGSVEFHVKTLYELYERLKNRRQARGALEFESQEPFFIFNEQRKIERIEARVRNDAHRMIEESMIAANVAAASELTKCRLAGLFRNHDRPDTERIGSLREFLHGLGLQLGGGDSPSALDFAATLNAAAGRQDKQLIETILLRGQKLAEYNVENSGHFGLALESYAHFTSPIRRYPDLLVHRAIKTRIARRKQAPACVEQMPVDAQHCSMAERRAEEATRDVVAWLKCEYMEDKTGESYSGVISGVTSFGIFIQLDNIFVEGLVHMTNLPADYYEFDPINHSLTGRSSGRQFRIGQSLNVIVARVSLDDRKIDFSIDEPTPTSKSKRKRRK
jgi:ribonuclease R